MNQCIESKKTVSYCFNCGRIKKPAISVKEYQEDLIRTRKAKSLQSILLLNRPVAVGKCSLIYRCVECRNNDRFWFSAGMLSNRASCCFDFVGGEKDLKSLAEYIVQADIVNATLEIEYQINYINRHKRDQLIVIEECYDQIDPNDISNLADIILIIGDFLSKHNSLSTLSDSYYELIIKFLNSQLSLRLRKEQIMYVHTAFYCVIFNQLGNILNKLKNISL